MKRIERDWVIKVGGAHLDEPAYLDALATLAANAADDGRRVILVHGGGKEIGRAHDRMGVPFEKAGGLRVTSDESMPLVAMVLCGSVNKRLVAYFRRRGIRAIGMCGADLGMQSSYLNRDRLARVGGPPRTDPEALRAAADLAEVLVVAPVCLAEDHGLVNVNADVAAQSIAVAIGAKSLDFVTDVEAVRGHDGALDRLHVTDVERLMRDEVVSGGMIPKLQSAVAAIDGGVDQVRVGSLESLQVGTATEVCA